MDIFQFSHRTLCPKNRLYVQCYSVLYSSTVHNSVHGDNLYNISDLTDNLDIKVIDLGISLALQQETALI